LSYEYKEYHLTLRNEYQFLSLIPPFNPSFNKEITGCAMAAAWPVAHGRVGVGSAIWRSSNGDSGDDSFNGGAGDDALSGLGRSDRLDSMDRGI